MAHHLLVHPVSHLVPPPSHAVLRQGRRVPFQAQAEMCPLRQFHLLCLVLCTRSPASCVFDDQTVGCIQYSTSQSHCLVRVQHLGSVPVGSPARLRPGRHTP
uniref:Uncharacterized protein n=1 Tax=Cacopsylla melanoneura TaxID=428564 RepID=A0A8D8PQ81_9HEMI